MSDPYERAKGGKLSFKGGAIDKKKKKKKHKKTSQNLEEAHDDAETLMQNPSSSLSAATGNESGVGGGDIYTIDAAKKMKYEELFPVEAKKFGYQPPKFKSVEDALDDRVKKKADRYCK